MFGLAASSEIVILAREEYDLRVDTVMFQGAKPLLTLLDRHTEIVVGVQNQRRGFHVLSELQRRSVPVLIEIVEHDALEVVLMAVSAVASAIVTDEIGDASQSDGGFKPGGVPENPVGHVPAVAAAGDAQAVRVDPLILL